MRAHDSIDQGIRFAYRFLFSFLKNWLYAKKKKWHESQVLVRKYENDFAETKNNSQFAHGWYII